jgi:hypothetical protein
MESLLFGRFFIFIITLFSDKSSEIEKTPAHMCGHFPSMRPLRTIACAPRIYQHESGADQGTANDIGKPMHPREQSAKHHKCNKRDNGKIYTQPNGATVDAGVALHHGRGHHAHNQQRGGGGVRGL